MNEGDVILIPLPQSDGRVKNRPAVILRKMPSHGDLLICGVSTQLHQRVDGFDQFIKTEDVDFAMSGLMADSVIRLGFLAVMPSRRVMGSIGAVSAERHRRLLTSLSEYLMASQVAAS
jgi:mRNA interferase MazF